MFINVATWLVVGLGAGVLVAFLFPGHKKYFTGTIFAGIVGAFVGGMVYSALAIGSIAKTIDFSSLAIAIVGSLLLVILITFLVNSEELGETG